MISIHVDDIKFTGRQNDIDRLVKLLEATFGKMTLQFDKFTNCGMTHERDKNGNTTEETRTKKMGRANVISHNPFKTSSTQ